MTNRVKVGDIINLNSTRGWDGSVVTEVSGKVFPVEFTHPIMGLGAADFEDVTVVSRAVDETKEGWTLASPEYTPQDNHEVSYCMGVATHWRETKVEPVVKRVNVSMFGVDGKLDILETGFGDEDNATATLNGKTWTIELD